MLRKRFTPFFARTTFVFFVVLSNLVLAVAAPAVAQSIPPSGLQKANTSLTNIGTSVFGADKVQPIEKVVGGIIQTGLTLIGVIFLVLTVYGGFIWMTARGEEAEAKRAKGIITMALIGMLVVVGAYAITAFVVGRLLLAGGLST